MPLLPHVEQFLKGLEFIPKKALEDYSIEEWRIGLQMTVNTFGAVWTPCYIVEDIEVAVDENHRVKTRFYQPYENCQELYVYVHGGGWCRGGLDSYDTHLRYMANTLGVAILSVDYRLAPENPFPAGSQDVFGVYQWVQEIFRQKHNFKKIYLGGDSAGGNISAGVICKLIEIQYTLPDCYIAIYPALDLSCSFPSYETFGTGYLLTSEAVRFYVQQYLVDLDHQYNFLASPLRYNHLEKFPKTIVMSADCDPLIDEQYAFVQKLKQEKVSVSHYIQKGTIHTYLLLAKVFPEVEETILWLKSELQK